MTKLTILIPALNEERALPALIDGLRALSPPPDEVLLVDGGSEDRTVELAQAAGLRTIRSPARGRAMQINFGVTQADGDIICVLHADTRLAPNAVAIMRNCMADPALALASFTPRYIGPSGVRWGSTINNWCKTYYLPLIARPHLFLRGFRLLYGDHAMFFRRAQFLAVGGCDIDAQVLEEAELCIRLSRLGRVRMVAHWADTSDRRISQWGRWRANWIYFKVAALWALGQTRRLSDHYPDIR